MKLTVVFMLVSLALCCYSASALLDPALGLATNLVSGVPGVVPVPVGILTDLLGGVQGCLNDLTPAALSAVSKLMGLLNVVG